jgi:hypothetical protein
MVVLDVGLADPRDVDRVQSCQEGAHGVMIPAEVVELASIAS